MGRAGRPERSRPSSSSPLTPQVESLAVPVERSVPAQPMSPEVTHSGSSVAPESGGPKWQTLERKDARLRADQLADLAVLVRRLSRQRRHRGERITDNTLIRVAVDALLEHSDALAGDNEGQLRESLTAALRDFRSSD